MCLMITGSNNHIGASWRPFETDVKFEKLVKSFVSNLVEHVGKQF